MSNKLFWGFKKWFFQCKTNFINQITSPSLNLGKTPWKLSVSARSIVLGNKEKHVSDKQLVELLFLLSTSVLKHLQMFVRPSHTNTYLKRLDISGHWDAIIMNHNVSDKQHAELLFLLSTSVFRSARTSFGTPSFVCNMWNNWKSCYGSVINVFGTFVSPASPSWWHDGGGGGGGGGGLVSNQRVFEACKLFKSPDGSWCCSTYSNRNRFSFGEKIKHALLWPLNQTAFIQIRIIWDSAVAKKWKLSRNQLCICTGCMLSVWKCNIFQLLWYSLQK